MDWLSTNRSIALLILCFVTCYSIGCLVPLILPLFWKQKERAVTISLIFAAAGSLAALATGILFAIHPMQQGAVLVGVIRYIDPLPEISLSFYTDRLAAFFMILTGGISLAAALHMVNWLQDVSERRRVAAVFNLFVLAILITILVNNVYSFLVALEGITLAFAYLALFRHNLYLERENVPLESMEASKTAFKSYLIFEHVGLMLLVLAFLLLAVQPLTSPACGPSTSLNNPSPVGFDFDLLRCAANHRTAPGFIQAVAFLLALAGFGIKAGVFPGHVWVPLVHPYSPTSIHAMMSGIVLKVAGIYGMYRFFFEFIGPVDWWWGLLVLLLAGATALVGVFYALVERDLKTSLASHSVENIGIILFGIGLALIYSWAARYAETALLKAPGVPDWVTTQSVGEIAHGFRLVESLALIASLYHLLNHSVFKSLLFFATGAIENRTNVITLDRLGGLMKRYPWTSTAFLVGAVSIAGFPPFNGFISEWLTLQSLFSGMNLFLPGMAQRTFLLVGIILALLFLALAFGMTALAFVKIAGEALLGAPRDPEVVRHSKQGDVPWHMRGVLVTLAAFCLVLGLFPAQVAGRLAPAAFHLSGITDTQQGSAVLQPGTLNLMLTIPAQKISPDEPQSSTISPTQQKDNPLEAYQTRVSGRLLWLTLAVLLLPFALGWLARRMGWKARYPLPRGPVWTGGTPYTPETMQYTGAAFSSLIWYPFQARFLPAFLRPRPGGEGSPVYLPAGEPLTERRSLLEVFRLIYDRLLRVLIELAQAVGDWVQNGDIRRYLLYIFLMFSLVLLALLVLNGRGR